MSNSRVRMGLALVAVAVLAVVSVLLLGGGEEQPPPALPNPAATDASVWVSDASSGELIRLDPSSGAVITRWEAAGSSRVAVTDLHVWLLDGTGLVLAVDRETSRFLDEIQIPGAVDLGVSGGQVWAGTSEGVVPLADGQGEAVPVGSAVVAMDGPWVLTEQALWRIDDGTPVEVTQLDPFLGLVGVASVGEDALVMAEDGRLLRVDQAGEVETIDLGFDQITGVGYGRSTWVLGDGRLARVEGSAVAAEVEVDPATVGPAVGSDAVWLGLGEAVLKVDPETLEMETIDLGQGRRVSAVAVG